MTVIVTGAAGHAGANLVRALIAGKRPVRALVHTDRKALEGLDIEIVEGDVRDFDSLVNAFKGADVVYHLAAYISISKSDWPLLEAVNINGTRNVIKACRNCGVQRLIHFSSIHSMARDTGSAVIDETCSLAESGHYAPYDRSKAAAEKEVLQAVENGLHAVVISPTAIIGPHDYRPSYFGEALLRLAGGDLPALVSGGYNWVDARDVVAGAMRAEKLAPTGAKYILSGHWVSLGDVADMVEKIMGVPAPGFTCPMWLARAGAPFISAFDRLAKKRPLYTSVSLNALCENRNVSHQKATRELDYSPRPFLETLTDTLRWFEANGRLSRGMETKGPPA
jgi:dihydroflavonol-4-reductase